MSIASEITRIKTNIANAYTSASNKGATLPEVRNSDNLASCIRNITGGGGDVVFAINQSSSTPDGKVLIREGKAGSNEFTSDIFSSKQYIEAKGWYDDNTIIGSFLNKENRRIRYIDDTWQEEVLETLKPVSAACSNFFWTTNNGRVISKNWYTNTYSSNDSREYFISDDGFTLVSNKPASGYLGAYNGVHYGYADKEADIYVYNPETSSYASSSFINGPGKRVVSFLMGDKIFLLGGNYGRSYRFYQLQEDNSYTTLQSAGELNSSYGILKIFGATGLEIGDYLLALNDGDTSTTNPESALYKLTSNTKPQLVVLQIQSGYILEQVSIPMLEQFETVDCRISYDRRNQVLMIGTKLGVFAYQFNSDTKTFSEMPLGLGLPAITMGTVYYPYMSPNKKRILVTLPMSGVKNDAGDYAEKVWIYQLSEEGEWFIIDNRTLNYQPDSVFTGIATGNVDEDGKYEIKTILK